VYPSHPRNRGERPAGAPSDEEIERMIEERLSLIQPFLVTYNTFGRIVAKCGKFHTK
jgi:hypothetical protein